MILYASYYIGYTPPKGVHLLITPPYRVWTSIRTSYFDAHFGRRHARMAERPFGRRGRPAALAPLDAVGRDESIKPSGTSRNALVLENCPSARPAPRQPAAADGAEGTHEC